MRTARNLAIEMALQQRAMGRRIAELRERARLTQEAAADKAGVTLRAYQKWEAGGGIQYANLTRLAEVFRVPVERITGEESAPDPFATSTQLDRLEQRIGQLLDDHVSLQAEIDQQNALLARQSEILKRIEAREERIERLVAVLEGAQVIEPAAEPALPEPEGLPPLGRDPQAGQPTEPSTSDPGDPGPDVRRRAS
jgi:transcriptional regulator with XRE-family HTH domain